MNPDYASFNDFLAACQTRAEAALDARLPAESKLPERLHQAMRYSTLGGGKRMRPLLVYAAGRAVGVDWAVLDGPACAVEFIHVYSLIHDDLPAMDNDDLRRGKPTCHKAFDEAMAILAGDGLQALAFHVLASDPSIAVPAENRIAMIEALATASGSCGMVGGQAIDLSSVGKALDLPGLENMHIRKTGALIRASVRLAALAQPGLAAEAAEHLDRYAKCVGLAFQIQDDILDVESDTQTLGKTQGKDVDHNKPTYPALLGLSEAKQKAADLYEQALESLSGFGAEADYLRELAAFIVARRN
jgi:farnesyl diphosphate synthase